jgi:hypothetical protein
MNYPPSSVLPPGGSLGCSNRKPEFEGAESGSRYEDLERSRTPQQRPKFINAEPRPRGMDHAMTVRAQERQVGKSCACRL